MVPDIKLRILQAHFREPLCRARVVARFLGQILGSEGCRAARGELPALVGSHALYQVYIQDLLRTRTASHGAERSWADARRFRRQGRTGGQWQRRVRSNATPPLRVLRRFAGRKTRCG